MPDPDQDLMQVEEEGRRRHQALGQYTYLPDKVWKANWGKRIKIEGKGKGRALHDWVSTQIISSGQIPMLRKETRSNCASGSKNVARQTTPGTCWTHCS